MASLPGNAGFSVPDSAAAVGQLCTPAASSGAGLWRLLPGPTAARLLPVVRRANQAVHGVQRGALAPGLSARLYGKTGWSNPSALQNNGWFVGWLQQAGGAVYFFALNLEPDPGLPADERFVAGRRIITEQILGELGLLKK
ncbi:MAG TPA: penicillin-binding transpeptidase domain-containing protein [Hymenobacter sp.]